ncbi:putative branched-chain-amino-acid aminotransferase [Nannochloris sp. 'desiccata']|nr:putative branched-chain-amino-acid aminotransferase [Chlorella desiccata (nom. nud.)]
MEPISKDVNVLATKDGAGPCTLPSGAWLLQAPRGAYTTCRTVGGATSIFELSFHIDRLVTSSKLMLASDAESHLPGAEEALKRISPAVETEALRPRVLHSLHDAIAAYREASGDTNGEVKCTILVTWATASPGQQQQQQQIDNDVVILTHATSLGAIPTPPIKIQIRGAPRQNAAAKDSEWVRQRRVYEDQKPADVNEVVLVDDDTGGVMEGLSSNFFALVDGKLKTAGEGILMGSVREAVLRVAEREGIPVVLEAPTLRELDTWEGAFVSSTSRLLLPVDEASAPELEPPVVKKFEKSEVVRRLVDAVMKEVAACSEPAVEGK